MNKITYQVSWSPSKMLDVCEKLVAFWDDVVKAKTQELGRLGALADNPSYLGEGKRIKRQLREAQENLFEAVLHHQEAKDAIETNRGSWAVSSTDLPFYFPMLRPDTSALE